MASFSLAKYIKKLHAHALFSELAKKHGEQLFFDISEQTPRKVAVEIMIENIKSIDTEKRIAVEEELAYIYSVSTKHASTLLLSLYEKEHSTAFEGEIECISDVDTVLYFYLHHNTLFEDMLFFHDFYAKKSYTPYEAKEQEMSFVESKIDEVTREFERLANKEGNATSLEVIHKTLDNKLFLTAIFEGGKESSPKINKETGELDRKNTRRKIEHIFIVYIPKEKRVLIRGTVGKTPLTYFLDIFLRNACQSDYVGKKEAFDLHAFKNLSFDFAQHNKGTPYIAFYIKGIAFSYAEGKKKMKLSFPLNKQSQALGALQESLQELGMITRYESFVIDSLSLVFTFIDQKKAEQGKNGHINIPCTITRGSTSLCPLFTFENHARTLLKLSEIDKGFVMEE